MDDGSSKSATLDTPDDARKTRAGTAHRHRKADNTPLKGNIICPQKRRRVPSSSEESDGGT